jgi:hypothetical protein
MAEKEDDVIQKTCRMRADILLDMMKKLKVGERALSVAMRSQPELFKMLGIARSWMTE